MSEPLTFMVLDKKLTEIRNEDRDAEEIEMLDRSKQFRYRSISDTPKELYVSFCMFAPYISSKEMESMCAKKLLIAQFLYPFYAGTHHVPIESRNYGRIYRGYLTLMKSLENDLKEDAIIKSFAKENIKMTYSSCLYDDDGSLVEVLCEFDINFGPFRSWCQVNIQVQQHENLIFVIFGIALLTIGRFPDQENYKHFQMKKAEELCELFNIKFDEDHFKDFLIPYSSGKLAYLAMSSAFEFRREVFKFLLKYAEVAQDEFKVVIAYVLGSLKYTLMTHVLLIEKYLIQKFPDFVPICDKYKYSQPNVNYTEVKKNMMEFIEKHKDVKPYIPFFVPYNERTAINPNTLHFLIISAQVFSERFNPTAAFRYHSDIECDFTSRYVRPTINQYFSKAPQDLFYKYIKCFNTNMN